MAAALRAASALASTSASSGSASTASAARATDYTELDAALEMPIEDAEPDTPGTPRSIANGTPPGTPRASQPGTPRIVRLMAPPQVLACRKWRQDAEKRLHGKLAACVRAHHTHARVGRDWGGDATSLEVARALESALYAAAARQHFSIDEAAYGAQLVQPMCDALENQCDDYPESVAAVRLYLRQMDAPAAVKFMGAKIHPRNKCRRVLLRSLLKHPAFAADRERARKTAFECESSCYVATIRWCKAMDTNCIRDWSSPQFCDIYSSRCGMVNSHVDPDSSVGAAYGCDGPDSVVGRILGGQLEPRAVGAMAATQLCPAATARERADIDLRSRQKIDKKASTLFQCPVSTCRARNCTYEEVQMRSLDEPSDIWVTCLTCEHRWRAR